MLAHLKKSVLKYFSIWWRQVHFRLKRNLWNFLEFVIDSIGEGWRRSRNGRFPDVFWRTPEILLSNLGEIFSTFSDSFCSKCLRFLCGRVGFKILVAGGSHYSIVCEEYKEATSKGSKCYFNIYAFRYFYIFPAVISQMKCIAWCLSLYKKEEYFFYFS